MDETQRHWDVLIGRIYETALSPGDWGELLEPMVDWCQQEQQDLASMESLLTHLDRAVRSSNHMHSQEDQNHLLNDMTNRLPWPMLMLDDQLHVVKHNSAADRIMASGPLRMADGGALMLSDPKLKQQLQQVVRLQRGRDSQLLHSEQEKLVLLCMPVFRSDAPDEVSRITTVVWVFADRSVAAPSVQSLADLFGISPAEARLLHLLCKVGNLNQSAELLSVSVHTARTQLKSIMGKTGISSQVALVSRAMSHALLATPSLRTHDGREERFMVLPDNRVLSWFEYGCPEGKPLLVMENQAGNLPCHEPHHDWYVSQGLRVLVVVRPGFGISSPCPNGNFVDFAADLRYFCERLNLQKPILAGYCFGGPYALAAAAKYPSLFERVGVIGSIVPWQYMQAGQLDPMHNRLLKMVDRDPRLFIALGKLALRGVNRSPEKFFSFFSRVLDAKDASLINDPAVQAITLPQLRQRWFQGARVIIDDYLRVLRPWGFELTDITIPCLVWHGALDRSVQLEPARLMAQAIPGARFHVLEEQGRYPVIECWQQFIEALAGSVPQTITQRA